MKILKETMRRKAMSNIICLLLGLLVVLFAIPLSAKENVKIKLPDGLYMYDAHIEQLENGGASIRFQKFVIVQNNIIFSSQEAINKFGVSKLNKLFTENKKYKILLGGVKIGEIHGLRITDNRGPYGHHKTYKQELFVKNIKEGPTYGSHGYGSAVRCMAVPEDYKEVKKKGYTTIPQEEVDKIAKLAKEKLLTLLINRKGYAKYKIKQMELKPRRYSEWVSLPRGDGPTVKFLAATSGQSTEG